MKFEDLSKVDQELVLKEFPEDIEKQAAGNAAVVRDMYQTGYEKLAIATADELDKLAEEEKKEEEKEDKEEEEEKMDEESEKKASALARFIERGYFDGLQKLGQERHNDPAHYIQPFVQEKIAMGGMTYLKRGGKKALSKTKAALTKAKKESLALGKRHGKGFAAGTTLGAGGMYAAKD